MPKDDHDLINTHCVCGLQSQIGAVKERQGQQLLLRGWRRGIISLEDNCPTRFQVSSD